MIAGHELLDADEFQFVLMVTRLPEHADEYQKAPANGEGFVNSLTLALRPGLV
jgi:hypothetical protein